MRISIFNGQVHAKRSDVFYSKDITLSNKQVIHEQKKTFTSAEEEKVLAKSISPIQNRIKHSRCPKVVWGLGKVPRPHRRMYSGTCQLLARYLRIQCKNTGSRHEVPCTKPARIAKTGCKEVGISSLSPLYISFHLVCTVVDPAPPGIAYLNVLSPRDTNELNLGKPSHLSRRLRDGVIT